MTYTLIKIFYSFCTSYSFWIISFQCLVVSWINNKIDSFSFFLIFINIQGLKELICTILLNITLRDEQLTRLLTWQWKTYFSFSSKSIFLIAINQINIYLYIRLLFKSGLSIYTRETTLILIHWKNLQTISTWSNYLRLVLIDTNMTTNFVLLIFMFVIY